MTLFLVMAAVILAVGGLFAWSRPRRIQFPEPETGHRAMPSARQARSGQAHRPAVSSASPTSVAKPVVKDVSLRVTSPPARPAASSITQPPASTPPAEPQMLPDLPDPLRAVAVVLQRHPDIHFYVLEGRRSDSLVLSHQSRLKRMGFSVLMYPVDADHLAEARASSEQSRGERLDSRVVGTIRRLFQLAADQNTSDIHLHRLTAHTDIFFRADGALRRVEQMSADEGREIMRSIYQGLAHASAANYSDHEFQAAQLKHAAVLPEQVLSLRVQRGPMNSGEIMVLRLLYKPTAQRVDRHVGPAGHGGLEDGIAVFRRFGYTDAQSLTLAKAARQPDGMVVFSGPTGSAKSSALKAALDFQHILYPHKNIITIEDPPEYPILGAVQLAVASAATQGDRDSQFARALNVAMRMDPDILMVGEIRDKATATTALDAVLTGHQMWTTIHAKDPFLIISRLTGEKMGVAAESLLDPAVLRVLVGQRLVPKLCPQCALPLRDYVRERDHDLVGAIRSWGREIFQTVQIARPGGCKACHGTGQAGRAVIAEVVEVSDALVDRIKRDGVVAARQYWTNEEGSLTMLRHALAHMIQGLCDPKDVVAIAGNLPALIEPGVLQTIRSVYDMGMPPAHKMPSMSRTAC